MMYEALNTGEEADFALTTVLAVAEVDADADVVGVTAFIWELGRAELTDVGCVPS